MGKKLKIIYLAHLRLALFEGLYALPGAFSGVCAYLRRFVLFRNPERLITAAYFFPSQSPLIRLFHNVVPSNAFTCRHLTPWNAQLFKTASLLKF